MVHTCLFIGFGVVAITFFLSKYSNDIPALFFLSIITCGILEYFTSFAMEKLFNARWWDYSKRKFNINGRVCLETLIPFGIAGTVIICFVNPIFINLINMLSEFMKHFLCGGLIAIFSVDCIVSFTIISSLKTTTNDLDLSEADDTENISNYVKEKAENAAMQLESDIIRANRKRRIKKQRKITHIKLRAKNKLNVLKRNSQDFSNKINDKLNIKLSTIKNELNKDFTNFKEDITKDLPEKLNNMKEELDAKIKEKFSNKSFLHKRIINAFPNLQIKHKINHRISKNKPNKD